MQRPEVAQRFIREARATTAIAHPNIVEVLDLDTDAARGITYIVQEFLEGETLEAHLADLEDQYWADQVITRFEAGDQTTRPISDLITELGL
jgi:serine/threonine protein kinase